MSHKDMTDSGVSHNTDHVNAINVNAYSPQQHQGLINAVISVLQTPEQLTMVSKQYSNERNLATEVQAYAKISGRDWTYYVKGLEISIGRNTDSVASLANVDTKNGPSPIDIDLGPAKVVSRKHAVIKFNMQHGGWELLVLGRNGAKVNFKRVQVGPAAPPVLLSSGTILDVGGTQMMFILPEQEPFVSQTCVNHLIPKLVSRYGTNLENHYSRNDVNALLYDILKESDYVKRQPPPPQQQPQHQIRTFKMYGNGGTHNREYNQGMQIDAPRYINGEANLPAAGGFLHSGAANDAINQANSNPSYPSSNASVSQMGFPQSLDFASDLSRDENRNVKPPHSYATMITQAILSTKEGVISLADIYKYISSNYAYYRFAKTGWQNSIRHNLSLNKAFDKVPRRPNEPGKGMKWKISDDYQRDFLNKWNAGKIGKVRRGSSVARQLQLHLSKYNSLPSQVEYTPEHTVIKQQNMQQNMPQTAKIITHADHEQSQHQWHSQMESALSVSPEAPSPIPSRQNIQHSSQQQDQQQQPPFRPSHLMPPPNSGPRVNQNPTNNALVSFNNASSSTVPGTSSGGSFSSAARKITPIITNTSSAPQASPTHGTLLRSPTKAFHITAMEAYTPERGSGQQSRSPVANSAEANFPEQQSKESKVGHNDGNQDNSGGPKNDKSQANRSSPGVWNLLQFSSVNNTPAVVNNNDTKNLNSQSSEKQAIGNHGARDLDTKDVASSPLKRHHNQHGGKELILDTDGAKISIVND
ncbi:forkhead family transcription factor FKH1 TDEL_0C04470 [Torulaspora delbrueckii]|uniref:Fork-head domain-containing protein n=1 Tax=Torulaspora delbrueckii TaxID=4950 RepID=G8ZS44_TORDE|nr:hypothetical protein TDEL_0C04470 [Torulaspora delbrueckii]CCE91336.1 hypothetical protein TDEL_0C04470 [Torulaspora delbrueckii]